MNILTRNIVNKGPRVIRKVTAEPVEEKPTQCCFEGCEENAVTLAAGKHPFCARHTIAWCIGMVEVKGD